MTRGDRWNPRDPDYRSGYAQGRAARTPARRRWWPLLLLPVCVALALAAGWAIGGLS